jgi:hypothetical protein
MACSALGPMIFYALSIIWPQQIVVLFGASPDDAGWISVSLFKLRRGFWERSGTKNRAFSAPSRVELLPAEPSELSPCGY